MPNEVPHLGGVLRDQYSPSGVRGLLAHRVLDLASGPSRGAQAVTVDPVTLPCIEVPPHTPSLKREFINSIHFHRLPFRPTERADEGPKPLMLAATYHSPLWAGGSRARATVHWCQLPGTCV